jgi:hypothetical protein
MQVGSVSRSPRDFPWPSHTDVGAAEWRLPYGESGILDFFLAVIEAPSVGQDLLLHSLRLVGNSCADTSTWSIQRHHQGPFPDADVRFHKTRTGNAFWSRITSPGSSDIFQVPNSCM